MAEMQCNMPKYVFSVFIFTWIIRIAVFLFE